ncbi:YbhB/YbcL family Raf kinase inhibitor-like protein [Allosalinactinospora lopnorensis]|uniref:YbhB/YbcL family Raf kinase inhibitor-like protein n=1 Tax=Allosalinactinospora lopnorensis TaxID=1352348 RepID=UPI0009E57D45|nr:YbhB/YbcL family Raf kinase inhibitor-like protein [Allosalinactinospora lopnorensis]
MFPVAPHCSSGSRHGAVSALPRARRRFAVTSGAVVLLAATAGCGSLSPAFENEMSADINVNSPMMQEGRPLPDAYTCAGEGVSPPLEWSGLPDEDRTSSIAVVADDPSDAHVFWVLYGMDPQVPEIRQNSVPQPAHQGQNSAGGSAYDPPCPEEGHKHEYRFTVYALSEEVDLPEGAPLEDSLEAIASRAIARGSLTTTSG